MPPPRLTVLSFGDICLTVKLVPSAQGQHLSLEVHICTPRPRLPGEGLFTYMPDLEPDANLWITPGALSQPWLIPTEAEYSVPWVPPELGSLCPLWPGGECLRAGVVPS